MSIEFMGDPYAAQLRAAKAEGELARIKDELREFAEENGINSELEPRDLLAKATGSFRSCAAMSDARYEEIRELKAEMEAMRPRLMPEGCEWPRFEDEEPVRFGDVGLDVHSKRRKCYGVKFTNAGFTFITDDMGREWWANDCWPLEDPDIDTEKRVKRPAVLAADGLPLEVGQTVYGIASGKTHHVTEVDSVFKRFKSMEQVDNTRWLDPICFTHQRLVLDADGAPVRKGDTVWHVDGEGPLMATEFRKPWMNARDESGHERGYWPDDLTHTKPEPPDSWERIEEDAEKDPCGYFGFDGEETCGKCPASGKTCEQTMALDLVRRAKALAERGE